MFYERAFLVNGTDMVAASNIFEAKEAWMRGNKLYAVEPKIEELNVKKAGLYMEVEGEVEAAQILLTLPPGKDMGFRREKDGRLLMWVTLEEALKTKDAAGPYLIAKVGM